MDSEFISPRFQAIGSDRVYLLTVYLPDTNPPVPASSFLATDPISATISAGLDQPVLASPVCVWANAALAQITLTVSAANSAAVAVAGDYLLRVTVSPPGLTLPVWEGLIRFTAVPSASVVAPPVYCARNDMLMVARWLDRVSASNEPADWLQERGAARQWTDSLLQRHYRGNRYWPQQNNLDHLLDGVLGLYRPGREDSTLAGWLATGGPLGTAGLITTGPTGSRIVRANALYAAALACENLLSVKDPTGYQTLAKSLYRKADNIISTCTAEVDTNGDGKGDVVIDLGWSDVLRG